MSDEAEDVSAVVTGAIVCMKVRANVFESALVRVTRDLRGQDEAIELIVWMKKTYREELERTLIAIEEKKPELAAILQEAIDEIDDSDESK